MSSDIDIHQLDPERQVLFVLNNSGTTLSISEIKSKLISYGVSPEKEAMKSYLAYTLADKRRKPIRDGLVYKENGGFRIMKSGVDYLKKTIMVIGPSKDMYTQETVGKVLSDLTGDIKICDPYFDDSAYQLLDHYLSCDRIKSIRVMYSKRFNPAGLYKIGKHDIQFRKISNLHDRFLIGGNYLYVLGTSLNGIGNGLSFMFNLTVYKDLFDGVFEKSWKLN